MIADEIERVVQQHPGLTATRIAAKLYGNDGYHERAAVHCRLLATSGRIARQGSGGPGDPYTYYPSEP